MNLPFLTPCPVSLPEFSAVLGNGLFLNDMFDDNDTSAHALSQRELTVKKRTAARQLPVEVIREALEIDETTPSGLRWKVRPKHHFKTKRDRKIWNTMFAGQNAGTKDGERIYWRIAVNGALYRSHRLIYLLANNVDPGELQVDHVNPAIPFPNIAANLRMATTAENARNAGMKTSNTSGVTGVRWHKQAQKWTAEIMVNYKQIHLGLFVNFADACAARKAAEEKYFGDFAFDASQNRNRQES